MTPGACPIFDPIKGGGSLAINLPRIAGVFQLLFFATTPYINTNSMSDSSWQFLY